MICDFMSKTRTSLTATDFRASVQISEETYFRLRDYCRRIHKSTDFVVDSVWLRDI
jgi:hypothetical protein